MTIILDYYARPQPLTPGAEWLEVALVAEQPAGDPKAAGVGQVLAMFALAADAIAYAVGLANNNRESVQVVYDGQGEPASLFATVRGEPVYATMAGSHLKVELDAAPGKRALWGVVVRPCPAPGESA